jgi:hypothetical protein
MLVTIGGTVTLFSRPSWLLAAEIAVEAVEDELSRQGRIRARTQSGGLQKIQKPECRIAPAATPEV